MLRTVGRPVKRWITRQLRQRELRRMQASRIGPVVTIGNAYELALANTLSADEQAALAPVEARREALYAADVRIEYQDYGAGSPSDQRTAAEMQAGREATATIRQILDTANSTLEYRLFLFHLIRAFQPQVVIELGTSLGFSACYQAMALRLNGAGRLYTLEGGAPQIAVARESFVLLGLTDYAEAIHGPFHDTLAPLLERVKSVDFAFIDGHHDGPATERYFERILDHCRDGAVLVFDDITWYESMRAAWHTIATSPHVYVAVNMRAVGVCVIQRDATSHHYYRLP